MEGEYIITKEEQIGYKSPVSSRHIINDDEQETPTEHNHKISSHLHIPRSQGLVSLHSAIVTNYF